MSWLRRVGERLEDESPSNPGAFHGKRRRLHEPGDYSVSFNCLGGPVTVPWEGTDVQDVIDSFALFLDTKDDEVFNGDWRTLNVRQNGKWVAMTFRASWIAGFTVSLKGQDVDRAGNPAVEY